MLLSFVIEAELLRPLVIPLPYYSENQNFFPFARKREIQRLDLKMLSFHAKLTEPG